MTRQLPKPLKETVEHIITDLVTLEKDDDLWDMPPMLMVVLNPTEDEPTKARVGFLDLSSEFWSLGDTPDLILAMARAFHIPEAPIPEWPIVQDDSILAIIARVEGWGLAGKRPPSGLDKKAAEKFAEEQLASLLKDKAGTGRIVDHPNAIEVKSYIAVTVEGARISYTTYRHPKHDDLDLPDDGFTEAADGRLYDVLDEFLSGMAKRFTGSNPT